MRKQHGDVIMIKVDSIPETAKQIAIAPGFIVERGEGSNLHTICEADGVTGYQDGETLYFKVDKKVGLLDHEEHKVQTYEPGIWRKGPELEYDVEADEARRTRD